MSKQKLINRQNYAILVRLQQLQENPTNGNFDINHLKQIHAFIFQDQPKLKNLHIRPGEFKAPIAKGLFWSKRRYLSTVNLSPNVFYSPVDKDSLEELQDAFNAINIDALSSLSIEDFAKKIADIYVLADYIHPFNDGNSRTLREFTRQLAQKCGYHLHWGGSNISNASREVLYVARDLSVNRIALERAKQIKKIDRSIISDIEIMLTNFKDNKNLNQLIHDFVSPIDFDWDELLDDLKVDESVRTQRQKG